MHRTYRLDYQDYEIIVLLLQEIVLRFTRFSSEYCII